MASKKQFPLSIVIGAVDKITAPLLGIQRKITRISAPLKKLNKSISRMSNAAGFNVMGAAIRRVGKSAWGLTKQVGILGAKIVGLGILAAGMATKMVVSFAKVGDTAAKTGKALGLTAEQVQEYEFMADRSGVSQTILNSSLIAFTKRLGESKAGTGGLFSMLKKVNPELLKQLQATENTGEALDLYLEYLGSIKSESKQAALASAAFSRSGVKMSNVAREGAAGMKALKEEAHRLGLVISNDAAKSSEAFMDELTNMKASLTGVKNILGSSLMPIIRELTVRFTEFVVKNRGAIKKWADSFAASLPTFDELMAGFKKVKAEVTPLIKALGWVIDKVGLLNAVLITAGAVIGGPLLASLVTLVPAVYGLGAALMATPIGWVLAGIAAIAAAVYIIYKNWDGIVGWFSDKLTKVKEAFGDGFLKGLWALFKEFNPFLLWLDAIDTILGKLDLVGKAKSLFGLFSGSSDDGPKPALKSGSSVQAMTGQQQNSTKVMVDFNNLPQGARVNQESGGSADLALSMGYSLMRP